MAPPFRALYAINVTGSEEELTLKCVTELAAALRKEAGRLPGLRVLGPAPAGVLRVNDRFRYRVMLSAQPSGEVRVLAASALRQFSTDKRYRNLVFYGDTDPLE